MKNCMFMLTIGLMIIYLSNCSKGITDPNEKIQNTSNSQIQSEMENVVISVPDSIPEKINELVVKKAGQFGFDGIRILGATSPGEESKYFVSFFNDGEGFGKEILVSSDGAIELLSEAEGAILNNRLNNSLKKTAWSTCWNLATFYENTNQSGTQFRFTQETTSTGWFHKIIWNLGSNQICCAYTYYGTLNDKVSSHDWNSHYQSGHATSPSSIKVRAWGFQKDASLSGPAYLFTSSACLETDDYDGLTYNLGYPQGADVDDTVSCIDMHYLVYDW